MLCLWAYILEDEVVPVEVTEIEVGISTCLIWNNPRTLRVFSHVITTLFHHCDLVVAECPCTFTLEILIELITKSYVIVSCCDEVCRCCVSCKSNTAVVGNLSLACLTVLCVDENNTGRSLGTIDSTSRSILED